ncbi:MAG: hypothetical protein K0U84_13615 [Actinomycetia bacterium]|nr:hypothetical protein [Actinomycetes bacterium]
MAFVLENLNPVGGQSNRIDTLSEGALGTGGPAVWTYITEDAHASVDGSGYFNDASSLLAVGDLIDVVVLLSGSVTTYGRHLVNSNASGVVDTTNVTVGTVTDSD